MHHADAPRASAPPGGASVAAPGDGVSGAGFFTFCNDLRFTYISAIGGAFWERTEPSALIGQSVWTAFEGAVKTGLYTHLKKALRNRESQKWVVGGGEGEKPRYEFHLHPDAQGFSVYFHTLPSGGDAPEPLATQASIAAPQTSPVVPTPAPAPDDYFTLSSDMLCVISTAGVVERANPAFARGLGYGNAPPLQGQSLLFLLHPDDAPAWAQGVAAARAPVTLCARFRRADTGAYRYFEWSLTPHPQREAIFAAVRDVTENKRVEEEVRWQASHDALTALPNRTHFEERLVHALTQGRQRNLSIGLLFIDLDRFKPINDTFGHAIGDAVLRHVSERLSACLRAQDVVARLGGDEFVALLPGIAGPRDAEAVAQKILHALARPLHIDGQDVYVTGSVGISLYPQHGTTPDALLKNADMAMYRAKDGGRGGYALYNEAMGAHSRDRLLLESRLSQAVDKQELLLHYQPQVSLKNRQMVGMEALVRWQSGDMGLVSPAQFIPLAEETGLIVPMGQWVVDEACRQGAEWARAGHTFHVSVNMSAQQLADGRFPQVLESRLATAGLSPQWFGLELTESVFIKDDRKALTTLNDLKTMGVKLSVDDFGTGYSSLAYLRRFPVDAVKIDRSFVVNINDNAADEAVVQAVIDLSHTLGMKVVAEGVETPEQEATLRALGCDAIQGYLYSRPLPPRDLGAFLSANAQSFGTNDRPAAALS